MLKCCVHKGEAASGAEEMKAVEVMTSSVLSAAADLTVSIREEATSRPTGKNFSVFKCFPCVESESVQTKHFSLSLAHSPLSSKQG